MNTRTALLSLVVALVLVGAGWFFLRPKPVPPPPAPTWLRLLDPQQVGAISVKWADGQSAVIERSPVPDTWVLIQHSSKGPQPPAWPVGSVQIRIALRLIADLEAVAPAEAAAPTASTTVTIKFRDGSEHQLTLSEMSLGGKTLVKIHGPPDSFRLGQANLSQMFQEGLRAWRSRGAVATVSQENAVETRARPLPHPSYRLSAARSRSDRSTGSGASRPRSRPHLPAPIREPAGTPNCCKRLASTLPVTHVSPTTLFPTRPPGLPPLRR